MNIADKSIKGYISDQLEIDFIQEIAKIYSGYGVNICVAGSGIELPMGQHVHSSYEFMIPISFPFPAQIDDKKFMLEPNKLFPINSGQFHGPGENSKEFCFLCIEIERKFLLEICESIYGIKDVNFENKSIVPGSEFIILLNSFIKECKEQQDGYEYVLKGLQYQIVVMLLRNIKSNINKENSNLEKRITKVYQYITENFDKTCSLEEMAIMAGISVYHFIRVFKAHTGKTPYDFLIDVKIQRAKNLLHNKEKSITDICFQCGFNNLSHFTGVFRKRVGVTPSEYRRILAESAVNFKN